MPGLQPTVVFRMCLCLCVSVSVSVSVSVCTSASASASAFEKYNMPRVENATNHML